MFHRVKFAIVASTIALVTACGSETSEPPASMPDAQTDYPAALRLALETATPGTVIEIPEGTFEFKRSLVLNTDGVTIRGAGMDKSILSFKGQVVSCFSMILAVSKSLLIIIWIHADQIVSIAS